MEARDLAAWADYLRDPRVYEHTSWNLQSESELEKYVWEAQAHAPDSLFQVAIACVHTDRLVGSIGFHTVSGVHRFSRTVVRPGPDALGSRHWDRSSEGPHPLGPRVGRGDAGAGNRAAIQRQITGGTGAMRLCAGRSAPKLQAGARSSGRLLDVLSHRNCRSGIATVCGPQRECGHAQALHIQHIALLGKGALGA